MDFTLSEAQDELAGLARKILAERDTPLRQWADLAAAGVHAAGLPEALGGAGLGLLEHCPVLTEIGHAVSEVPYLASIVLGAGAIGVGAIGVGAIATFGTPDQQRRWAVRPGAARSCSPPRYRRRTATTLVSLRLAQYAGTAGGCYPGHRYFTAAKHHEFALGGATAQLRRIGADLAR